jgi:HEAT repeat protein
LWALLQIRPGDQEIASQAAPYLKQALDHDEGFIRAEAAIALGGLGEFAEDAIPRLKQLLHDDSPMVRAAAEEALKKLEQPAPAVEGEPETGEE